MQELRQIVSERTRERALIDTSAWPVPSGKMTDTVMLTCSRQLSFHQQQQGGRLRQAA
jgi:hypothetical protein